MELNQIQSEKKNPEKTTKISQNSLESYVQSHKYKVDLAFRCPRCHCEWWLSWKEVKEYGKFVCVVCDRAYKVLVPKTLRLRKLRSANRELKYQAKYATKTTQQTISRKSEDISKYVSLLRKVGYKKRQALEKIKAVQQMGLKDENDFIRNLLK